MAKAVHEHVHVNVHVNELPPGITLDVDVDVVVDVHVDVVGLFGCGPAALCESVAYGRAYRNQSS